MVQTTLCAAADTSDGQGQSGERSGSRNANSDSPSSLSPTAGPPGESPSAKTVSASRDSGCYASSEQLKKMPAGHHGGVSPGTSAVVGPTRLNSRGANGETKCLCVHCGKPKLQGQVSATGRGVVSGGDGEKSDRELSAEDQEVFSITAGSQPQAPAVPVTLSMAQSGVGSGCNVCTQSQLHSHSRCESKSSKQSLSSACTQLTSLSPEEEVGLYDSRHDHSLVGEGGHWSSGCVQCVQEAALLTSQMAGMESSGRISQQRGLYGQGYRSHLHYGAYDSYTHQHLYPEGQVAYLGSGGVTGVGARSGQRTPGSMHYTTPVTHYNTSTMPYSSASHYGSSASDYGASAAHYGGQRPPYPSHSHHYGVHPHGSPYSSQGTQFHPSQYYGSHSAAYGSQGQYSPSQALLYGSSVSHPGAQRHHSPLTLSLSASSAQSSVGLKLNRSVSHEGTSSYPACANPRGPDYAAGSSQKPPSRSPTRSLIPLVTTKLGAEGIILTDEPYSTPVSNYLRLLFLFM